MLTGSCHCGAIRFTVPARPVSLTLCNCSICRRYGSLWAFYPREDVRIDGHPENSTGYVWGDRTITTFHCQHCGSVTHWEPLKRQDGPKFGLNMRNFDPGELGELPLRRFDGAVSWTYLD